MRGHVRTRVIEVAEYIIENKATVRQAAQKFNISKSTIHMDVTDRLIDINEPLSQEVRKVLDFNLAQRHIRGGMATHNRWEEIKGRKQICQN